MVKIAIVIVNWNGYKDTRSCLNSIQKLSLEEEKIVPIIIDNASDDSSVENIKKMYPEVIIIKNLENRGFSGANNQGLLYGLKYEFDYIWLLNNDTIVSEKSLHFLLVRAKMVNGIIGSKIYFAPGHEYHKSRYKSSEKGKIIWYAGGKIDWGNMYAFHRGVDEVDKGQFDIFGETDYVTGCSMLIPINIVKEVGLLDEKFFMYFEDVDYCLRARRKQFHIVYEPKSIIWHINAGSSGKPGSELHQYYQTRNRLLIGFKYAPFRTKIALLREGRQFMKENSVKKIATLDAFLGKWGKRK